MRNLKPGLGILGAVIPVLYCGGLLYYFSNVESFTGVPVGDVLGPTKLGLAVVGLLFLLALAWKIWRLASQPAAPGPGKSSRSFDALPEERSDFDPDAAIARYLAKRPEGSPDLADPSASPPPSFGGPRPAPRPGGFGRKTI